MTAESLEDRVTQFRCLELPGQPMSMHMGTSYLVNDLWNKVKEQAAEIERLRTASKQALVALDNVAGKGKLCYAAIDALRKVLP
jgi:hypothetical protein